MLGTDKEQGALKGRLAKLSKQKPLFLLEYNFLIYLVYLLNFWHVSCCVHSSWTAGLISGDLFLSAFLSSAHLFCICSLMWELVYRYNGTQVWKQFLKRKRQQTRHRRRKGYMSRRRACDATRWAGSWRHSSGADVGGQEMWDGLLWATVLSAVATM